MESADTSRSKRYGPIPESDVRTDSSTNELDGRWELKTLTGAMLDLIVVRDQGMLTERDSSGKMVTRQTVTVDLVNDQILVLGLHARSPEGDKEKVHPSMLLFSRQDDSFQILWRYADANSGWSPVELKSHKPF